MADRAVGAKDRPITDALSAPGLIASTALSGLGGFIYDRYIKKNKDIKSNLLKGLLFGGGGALAYGAYTLASEALRQHGNVKRKASGFLTYEHEEPDGEMVTRSTVGGVSPSAVLAKGLIRESRLGGAAEGGLIGYTAESLLSPYIHAGRNEKLFREYLKNTPSSLAGAEHAAADAIRRAQQANANSPFIPTGAEAARYLPDQPITVDIIGRGKRAAKNAGTVEVVIPQKIKVGSGKSAKTVDVAVPVRIRPNTRHPILRNFLPRAGNFAAAATGAVIGGFLGTPESQDAIRRGDLWGAITNSAH